MKSFFSARHLSWLLLLTLPLWFGGCRKDGDATPAGAAVQGSWRITSYTIDPAFDLIGNGTKTNDLLAPYAVLFGQQFVDCLKAITVTFNAGGTIAQSIPPACTNTTQSPIDPGATWALVGNKMRLTNLNGQEDYDVVVSGSTLKLSQTAEDDYDGDGKKETGTVTLTLTKV